MGTLILDNFFDDHVAKSLLEQDSLTKAHEEATESRQGFCVVQLPADDLLRLHEALPGPCTCGAPFPDSCDISQVLFGEDSVLLPARASQHNNCNHRDNRMEYYEGRVCKKEYLEGYLAVVYLSGDGTMVLTRISDGVEYPVEVVPGRLLIWCNTCYQHRIDGTGSMRSMIGPIHFGPQGTLERGGDYHAMAEQSRSQKEQAQSKADAEYRKQEEARRRREEAERKKKEGQRGQYSHYNT